ncbi:MAG: hypothetical protein GX434_01790 [Peptococcaceae bacterium]|nr:hypothetical protein [Peptococcaceae bacterium]
MAKAKKIKVRVRKGRWFVLVLPALSFRFLKRVLRFGLKFVPKDKELIFGNYQVNHRSDIKDPWEKHFRVEEVEWKELAKDLDLLFDELAALEPFVLVEVEEETENVYVKIETV